jgi:hypothetical protein
MGKQMVGEGDAQLAACIRELPLFGWQARIYLWDGVANQYQLSHVTSQRLVCGLPHPPFLELAEGV